MSHVLQTCNTVHPQVTVGLMPFQMQSLCVALAVVVFGVAQSRLVFPAGSDLGYIISGKCFICLFFVYLVFLRLK